MSEKKIVIHLDDRRFEDTLAYEKACEILGNYDPSHPEATTKELIDLEFSYVDVDNIRDARIVKEIISKYTYARMSKKEKFLEAVSRNAALGSDALELIKDLVEELVIKVRRERNYQYHFHCHQPDEWAARIAKLEDREFASKNDIKKRL